MLRRLLLYVFLPGLCGSAFGQVLSFPTGNISTDAMAVDMIQTASMNFDVFTINGQNASTSPLQTPSGSISKLDLKAPGKAQSEYTRGYQLLLRKDMPGAVQHLSAALARYPSFVAAHNALGTAYMNQGENEKARDEFTAAVALDDHMPNSYLNLGCAALALKQYPAAEDAFRKAASIAPLDPQLMVAATYGEYTNKDYPAVLDTVRQIHQDKHKGAALVHYFAAAAYEAQNNLPAAEQELKLLLREDPKSHSAGQFQKILLEMKAEEDRQAERKLHPPTIEFAMGVPKDVDPEIAGRLAQLAFQELTEKEQIEQALADPDGACSDCGPADEAEDGAPMPASSAAALAGFTATIRAAVDEVSIVFAATDRGKPVTDLTSADIGLRDNNQAPSQILGFRNETQLPLRLGLVIDTSDSVTERLGFEQAAAAKFLDKVLTDQNDLAFVVGVNNTVLLVQDFTSDRALTTRAINQLAPGGGTALWDAVAFASQKLTRRPENQPVARVLVVISDGEDNSSSISLKQAIARAQHGEVAIYTVSTRDGLQEQDGQLVSDRGLQTLSDLSGGAAFKPGSIGRLNGSLSDLQQVIRSRYLVTYKPASFQRDGRYRPIDITAQREGRKLRVYARKGYYAASSARAETADR